MIEYTQNFLNHPKVSNAFDWSVFAGGMASLVFAIAMTVLGAGDTRNADADLDVEIRTSL